MEPRTQSQNGLEEMLNDLQPGQALILTGSTGIGKSTRFPLTVVNDGKSSILVVTPTRVGATVLSEYVNSNDRLQYRSLDEVYADALHRKLPPFDYIMIDDIQQARLEMSLLILILQHLQQRLFLVGISVPAGLLRLLSRSPLQLRWKGEAFPVLISYLDIDPLSDEQKLDECERQIRRLLPVVEGHILIIVASDGDVDRYTSRLLPLGRIRTVKSDNYQREVFRATSQQIIISTPILESTITIPDLELVVDSMQTMLPVSRPNGRIRLVKSWISRIQSEQRSGRAGRTRSGVCVRLCSEATYLELPIDYPVELDTMDLTIVQAELLLNGFNVIPEERAQFGLAQLRALGLLSEEGELRDPEALQFLISTPMTIVPGFLLHRSQKVGLSLPECLVYTAMIEIAGPYLEGTVTLPHEPGNRVIKRDRSDFTVVLNIVDELFRTERSEGLWKNPEGKLRLDQFEELIDLLRELRKRFQLPSSILDLKGNLTAFRDLVRETLPMVIYGYDDITIRWVNSSGRELVDNIVYPRTGDSKVQAALAIRGDVLLLGLDLD